MLQIGNTIISLDLIEKNFVCDLSRCFGNCCVEGDGGAPLNDEEVVLIKDNYDKIEPLLTEKGKKIIKKYGIYYKDNEGDTVTTLVNNKECAFAVFEGNMVKCGIEIAEQKGVIDFQKPISCHLYPVRIKEYSDFTAVNYHSWNICKPAVKLGNFKQVKVYEFLKDALIRKFGQEWYNELDYAAKHIDEIKNLEKK